MKYSLVGIDGNAYSVMVYVTNAMREQKFTESEINEYLVNAKSDDYDHLLAVSTEYTEKCNNRAEV